MNVLQAAVLGVVQGVGEFLPISSSAHLVLVPWLFHWPDHGLMFDVALHLGTMLAVIVYFWRELLEIVYFGLAQPRSQDGRLFWYLVVASVPGALLGYLFEEQAETIFRHPLLIAGTLTTMGLILWWADMRGRKTRRLEDLSWTDSILIGISQGLAIIPGVSRSGITMTTGLIVGLQRETAAHFSFLLSVPIIAGAALYKLRELSLAMLDLPFIVGIVTAAVVGYLSIRFLLNYLRRGSYLVFAIYRFVLALIILTTAWLR
ncbi:MAG: undecaprenyl-diphosphatase UppP [Firmicutes bacterium]|jgi:undecaprenyl-diphosphatase|nr:undecaprenyl-diphosphatase UppP [Bacillota bacterium]